MTKNKKLNAFLLLTGIFVLTILIIPPSASAYGFGLGFGGRVVSKVQCTCSVGSQITVQGSSQFSGTYLDTGGARSYGSSTISPGLNIIGMYTPGGACLIEAGPTCAELPITKGTITLFGVSNPYQFFAIR